MSDGYMGKILEVDLTTRTHRTVPLDPKLARKYVGGSGLAAHMLLAEASPTLDPLGPENTLILMTGPLAGTVVPTSNRFAAVAKSPLTGAFGESDCGGSWGGELKRAGFDGLVIRGRASSPVYLWIHDEQVEIRDAGTLWGRDSWETDDLVRQQTDERASVACIGPGGEQLVRFAAIMNEGRDGRAAGRSGMGAVMGSKRLKAVAVRGSLNVPVADAAGLRASIKEWSPKLRQGAEGMHKYGTSGGTPTHDKMGNLPEKNWQMGSWPEGANRISGVTLAERGILVETYACRGCVIGCGRVVKIEDGPYAMEKSAGPEYETVAMLGSNCLVDDLQAICKGNELCNRYGIDTISTGAATAFAMEAYDRGLLSAEQVDGVDLRWGSAEGLVEMIKRIGERRGLGKLLGEGVRRAAAELGPQADAFAIHVKGQEPPAHDPRAFFGNAIAFATSARGACHLSSFTHGFERVLVMPEFGYDAPVDRFASEPKPMLVANGQNLMGMFDALKACKFLLFGGARTPQLVEWLNYATGWGMDQAEFLTTGERIFNAKRLYNLRSGLTGKDDTLPARYRTEPRPDGSAAGKLPPFEPMLAEFYRVRGWDSQGVPLPEKLAELGLS
ncbi:MAG: aldehyde ferredoxin oxidoreductase family protein [Chloroflexota bacterium]